MAKQKQQYKVVHTKAQKFWGIMGLVALFVCGIMVGLGFSSSKKVIAAEVEETTNPVPEIQIEPKPTCVIVEELLLEKLPAENTISDDRIMRAKIYANLSERGCAENSEKYVELAKQELEIARAITDDEFSQEDTIEVVETYKRLDMQMAAEEIFETAKKLTAPAIDFILEVEKIINEQ